MCDCCGNNAATEPQVVEFGPYRVIGMRYVGKNEQGEIPAMWGGETGFVARMGEIKTPAGCPCISFGLCRCLPGATDGSFEYIAALPATPDAPIPAGMVEARIAGGSYVAFPVASLAELMPAWGQLGAWLAAHPEWQAYCGDPVAKTCDCENHPTFELYPAQFATDGKLFIYMPIRPRG